MLSLFGVLLFAGIRIAMQARDPFGRLLVAGIMGWIGLQTLVNLGAVTGLLPITGVPLPFLSFGGTALVVTLAGVGVVASVALDGVRSTERRNARSRSSGGTEPTVRVVIAGGGTAGHITPSIAVANRLRAEGATVEFIGSPAGPEASLVPAAGFRFHGVRAVPFRREISLRSAAAPFVALRSVAAARPIVRDASVVLGMGGYASVAPVLAARSLRVPTVVHEQNAVPGLANRFLARTVTAVALTFASSRARLPASVRAAITGLPLRREVLVGRHRSGVVGRGGSAGRSDLQAGRTTVLVTGGSQGALHVDRTIAGAIPLLAGRADLQMLVLTGAGKESVVTDAAEGEMDLIVRALPYPRSDGARARRRRRRRRPRRRQHDPRARGLRHPVDPGALPARHR